MKEETRGNKSFANISPEIMKMLEEMSENKQKVEIKRSDNDETLEKAYNTKIVLNDSEYGKY